jgi:hypothetical protein
VRRNIYLKLLRCIFGPESVFEMLPLLACAAGIFLGLNFNALVLLPVSFTFGAIFIFDNISSGLSFHAHLGDLLVGLICAQGGYMLGLVGRDMYAQILARFQAVQSDRV